MAGLWLSIVAEDVESSAAVKSESEKTQMWKHKRMGFKFHSPLILAKKQTNKKPRLLCEARCQSGDLINADESSFFWIMVSVTWYFSFLKEMSPLWAENPAAEI